MTILQVIEDAILFREEDALKNCHSYGDFEHCIRDIFQKAFDLSPTPDFIQKYEQSFATFRQKEAILTYAARLESLPEQEREVAKDLLRLVVEAILNQQLDEIRYDHHEQMTLNVVMQSFPQLREIWIKDLKENPEDLVPDFKLSGYQVLETDDACHLILSGTEVLRSCLSAYGQARQNKCLLGLLLNGHNRLALVVKDGRIVARSVLRLVWDEKKEKPALLQGKAYFRLRDDRLEGLLDAICQKKASLMGVSLYREGIEDVGDIKASKSDQQTSDLYSFGGLSPFEYVDSLRDRLEHSSQYNIKNARIISTRFPD